MNEFLLKEIAFLLYRLVHVRDELEMSREDYFKDLEERYKKQLAVTSNKKK